MSANLVEAALRACITLSSALEATIEGKSDAADADLAQEVISEVQADLMEAYNGLTDQLTIDLDLDARQLVRDLIVADLESSRAILFARTGLRFPIGAKE